jgi:ribose/xylose/arabinose/galactoside ABC-type transport system permease subunit
MKKDGFYYRHISPLLHHKVFTLVLLYIAMIIIFTVWSELRGGHFLKISTFKNVLNSLVISAFLTIGAGCLLIAGHIDLSQSAIGAFGGMVLATAVKSWGLPWYGAIVLGLALCCIFGALNALLVTKFRFPSFIGTLAMASMARGLMYLFSSIGNKGMASNIAFLNEPLSFIGKGQLGPIPFGIIVMLVFFIIYGVMIAKSRFGMKVTLIGGNPVAAMLAGINSTAITYILFINSALLGGVAGIFNSARLGQGALLALTTNQFTGITAAILGGISFGGGAGGMGGAFVGLLILNTFQIGMGIVGVNPFWVNVFSGVLLLVALAFDFISQKRSRSTLAVY